MQPMLQKLKEVEQHVQGPAREAAVSTLQHLASLDLYSEKAGEMLAILQKAEQGNKDEQDKAIKLLEVGLLLIKGGMHKHMLALKQLKESNRKRVAVEEAVLDSPAVANAITGKLNAVVEQMQKKVDAELADPARKDDPLVGLDVQMLESMKKAVSKSEALVAAAEAGMAKEPEKKAQYQQALKIALHKVSEDLKTDMKAMKEKAMVLTMVAKMMKEKQAEAEAKAKAPADDRKVTADAPADPA